jgi:ribulose-phosphate 3-epimerase
MIVPAIITNSQKELDTMIDRVRGRANRIQLDVMDGKFVPNTSLNFDFKLSNGFEYEAHLMIEDPLDWVDRFANKVDIIAIHIEALEDLEKAIDFVKGKGVRLLLALKPETEPNFLSLLSKIDGVLIMTVTPGDYCINKEFNPKPLGKIRKLRSISSNFPIEVDGCMNPETAKLAKEYGANIFVSGSYIFKNNNIDKAIKELRESVS